jgi:GntR family transcriptional regulator
MSAPSMPTMPKIEAVTVNGVMRSSPVPLHHQIRRLLLQQINDGLLAEGAMVPSERWYAERLGVSLAPVRQAIIGLVRDGYLERVAGKGTRVRSQKRTEEVTLLWSFSERMRREGRALEMRVIAQRLVPTTREVREALVLPGR